MKPLAHILRPQKIDDIIGQEHLKKVFKLMIKNKKLTSCILYGEPGIGKTTLANVIASSLTDDFDIFNASIDSKEHLKKLISLNKILIVDEIHRMKKDTQDYLLPFIEKEDLKIIGITTINPYRAVNPAIRSRMLIYKLHPLKSTDLLILVDKAINYFNHELILEDNVIKYLLDYCNNEARSLLNMIEALHNCYPNILVSLDMAKEIVQKPNHSYDKDEDSYYDTLSGLHKSIRGSDVDASLHYLAKLITFDDLLPLVRRLFCIAYEDISLANPLIGPKVKAACDIALELGLPEACLPLSSIVVEMALSPKSNSSYLAYNKASSDIENGKSGKLPKHLKNVYDFEDKEKYLYPHDYPGGYVKQQYLPDILKDVTYYIPKTTSQHEKALKERFEIINSLKKK